LSRFTLNQRKLLLLCQLFDGIFPFQGFLLCLVFLIVYETHRSPVLRVFCTFTRIMCFDSFFKICRPPGIKGSVTTFYNVCILHLYSFLHFSLCILSGRAAVGPPYLISRRLLVYYLWNHTKDIVSAIVS